MGPIYAWYAEPLEKVWGYLSGITAGECGVVKSNLIIKYGKEICLRVVEVQTLRINMPGPCIQTKSCVF